MAESSQQHVIAITAVERIVARAAGERVIPRVPSDLQPSHSQRRPRRVERVVAIAAIHGQHHRERVGQRANRDRVITAVAVEDDVRDADRIQDQRRGPLRDGELPGRILRDGQ